MQHQDRFHYQFTLLQGTDADGAPCYSYMLFPPGLDKLNQTPDNGVTLYSGWGEPSAYDAQQAMQILHRDYLR